MYVSTYKSIGYGIIALGVLSAIVSIFTVGFNLALVVGLACSGVVTGILLIGVGDIIQTLIEIKDKLPKAND